MQDNREFEKIRGFDVEKSIDLVRKNRFECKINTLNLNHQFYLAIRKIDKTCTGNCRKSVLEKNLS